MRIVSFLPSATEIVYYLGLGDQLVGVTHECDYPPEVSRKPVIVRSSFDGKDLSPQQIDEVVSRTLHTGKSLYIADEALLQRLQPDLILTQDLCQVCAPSGNEVSRVVQALPTPPKILWLTPNCLSDIFHNLIEVGEATGNENKARRLVETLKERVKKVSDKTHFLKNKPRVFCVEWLSPIYNAGHWMPELVELAGGVEGLGQKGEDSVRLGWDRVLAYAPEILILSPCGFHLEGALGQLSFLTRNPGWEEIPAVKEGRVYCVDANSYFARPGPRVVDGLELMGCIIHPELFSWNGPPDAYRQLTLEEIGEILKNGMNLD